MDMQYNINKIHGSLVTRFDDVKIEEKSSHKFGNYFQLSATKDNTEIKMIITKKDVENDTFNWSYYANPLKENSDLVERVSNINDIYEHITDIIDNKRFNKEYISAVEEGLFSRDKIGVGDVVITPDGEGVVIPNESGKDDGNIWVNLSDESKSNVLTGTENIYLPSEVKKAK